MHVTTKAVTVGARSNAISSELQVLLHHCLLHADSVQRKALMRLESATIHIGFVKYMQTNFSQTIGIRFLCMTNYKRMLT